MASADFALGLVALVIGIDPVSRVREPYGTVGLHHHIVRAVEAFALIALGHDGDAAVVLGARDPPVAVLAGDEASLAVDRIAVAVTGRMTENADNAGGLVETQHAVIGDVAPDKIAPGREIGRPLRPAAALIELFDPRRCLNEMRETPVEHLKIAVRHSPTPF
jgi:hypothetical protein